MPLYDKEGSDCWVEEGTVYIKIEGKEKDILFHYYSEEDIPKNDYYPYVFCNKGVDGTMVFYRDCGFSSINVTNNTRCFLCPCVDNQN